MFLDQRGAVATSVPLKAGFISDDLAKKNSESLDPGAVGAYVMSDDGVRTAQLVACQKVSILLFIFNLYL
ncbi:MAG: hypothetical protein DMG91_05605 [Acidobacteria bacterium]|nr:MAG: hypothetical protein DMG91_05605 [Acidobacteriota bacterium]